MVRGPSLETNSCSYSQEIHLSFMQPGGSLPYLQEPAAIPVLCRINTFHAPSYFLKIHFNIILTSALRSSKWFFFCSGFLTKTPYVPFLTLLVPHALPVL
jgi:hypothetical protein